MKNIIYNPYVNFWDNIKINLNQWGLLKNWFITSFDFNKLYQTAYLESTKNEN